MESTRRVAVANARLLDASEERPERSDGVVADIRGLAVPFGVPDDRPGYIIEDGRLVEYAATIFEPEAFSAQLSLLDPLLDVRYTVDHAGYDPHGFKMASGRVSLPIGKVTRLSAGPRGLTFEAQITDTGYGADVAKAVLRGEMDAISTLVSDERYRIDGKYLRVSQARCWEVTHVLWAQFSQTRVIEAVARGADAMRTMSQQEQDAYLTNVRRFWETFNGADETWRVGAQFSADNVAKIREHVMAIRGHVDGMTECAEHFEALDALLEAGSHKSERSWSIADEVNVRIKLAGIEAFVASLPSAQ